MDTAPSPLIKNAWEEPQLEEEQKEEVTAVKKEETLIADDKHQSTEEELPALESFDQKDVDALSKLQARFRAKKDGKPVNPFGKTSDTDHCRLNHTQVAAIWLRGSEHSRPRKMKNTRRVSHRRDWR